MSRPLNGSFGNDRIMLLARFLGKRKFIFFFNIFNFVYTILYFIYERNTYKTRNSLQFFKFGTSVRKFDFISLKIKYLY